VKPQIKDEPAIWTKMDNNKTKYYTTLCIDFTATREDIAAAYRKLSLQNHPMRCPREQEA